MTKNSERFSYETFYFIIVSQKHWLPKLLTEQPIQQKDISLENILVLTDIAQ
jgi:hypothetical protein